jgi:AsmA-like C-terminal region
MNGWQPCFLAEAERAEPGLRVCSLPGTEDAVSRQCVFTCNSEVMRFSRATASDQPNPGQFPSPEMSADESRKPNRKRLRWVISLFVVALLTAGAAFAALHWPYSKRMVVPALQDTFKTQITFQKFHRFYFPHPGCELKGLALASPRASTPLATVQKMIITGRYSDLLFRPYHLANILLQGLYVRVPAPSKRGGFQSREDTPSKVSIGLVNADAAVLEVVDADQKEPLKFEMHRLRVGSIAAGKAMTYDVDMTNPEPPGELSSTGAFGPWQPGKIGEIPLHGSVKLMNAKLDKYPGIAGTLSSTETFSGKLERVQVIGEATVPDFELKTAKHKIAVTSRFQVIVNGIKGEAYLKDVTGEIGPTPIKVTGNIHENTQHGRRETTVYFAIDKGRVEDLLWLFSSDKKPAMMGDAACSGHVRVSKFGPGFVESLTVTAGKFQIRNGHFQEKAQLKTNVLSARASGMKINDPRDAPEVAVANLSSNVVIEKGVAHFSTLYFEVPGARARVDGTYHFETDLVNLRGDLWTNAVVSQDTTGVKAALLKPLDPLFRRKHAGAMVAATVTGDIHDPVFGTLLAKKNTSWAAKGPTSSERKSNK